MAAEATEVKKELLELNRERQIEFAYTWAICKTVEKNIGREITPKDVRDKMQEFTWIQNFDNEVREYEAMAHNTSADANDYVLKVGKFVSKLKRRYLKQQELLVTTFSASSVQATDENQNGVASAGLETESANVEAHGREAQSSETIPHDKEPNQEIVVHNALNTSNAASSQPSGADVDVGIGSTNQAEEESRGRKRKLEYAEEVDTQDPSTEAPPVKQAAISNETQPPLSEAEKAVTTNLVTEESVVIPTDIVKTTPPDIETEIKTADGEPRSMEIRSKELPVTEAIMNAEDTQTEKPEKDTAGQEPEKLDGYLRHVPKQSDPDSVIPDKQTNEVPTAAEDETPAKEEEETSNTKQNSVDGQKEVQSKDKPLESEFTVLPPLSTEKKHEIVTVSETPIPNMSQAEKCINPNDDRIIPSPKKDPEEICVSQMHVAVTEDIDNDNLGHSRNISLETSQTMKSSMTETKETSDKKSANQLDGYPTKAQASPMVMEISEAKNGSQSPEVVFSQTILYPAMSEDKLSRMKLLEAYLLHANKCFGCDAPYCERMKTAILKHVPNSCVLCSKRICPQNEVIAATCLYHISVCSAEECVSWCAKRRSLPQKSFNLSSQVF